MAQAVEAVKTPRLLFFVASPLVRFVPTRGTVVPRVWEEATYWFGLRIFGFLPFGEQAVRITFSPGADDFRVRDDGYSRLVKRWDHRILIERSGAGVRYCDELNIEAGVLTPVVWLFAFLFYRHRQRRWSRLVKHEFDYQAAGA